MAQNQNFYELYRVSSVGIALADTLDELIRSDRIKPQLAMRILQNFDQSVSTVLSEKVKARMSLKGHLHIYHRLDDVWRLIVTDARIKVEHQDEFGAEKVKIVTCPTKTKPSG